MSTQSEQDLVDGVICGPHCDAKVLHIPGTCETCDEFPTLQLARQMWDIGFTGIETAATGATIRCPAETERGLDVVEQWPRNRPTAYQSISEVYRRAYTARPGLRERLLRRFARWQK